jgi:hypothetical protein
MDPAAQRDLKILTAIEDGRDVTQRGLAKNLDIALGLANLYLKRLARKGYIKITTIPPNRLRYLVTPQGIAEKTRLTYEFMSHSLRVYRESRQALHAVLRPLAEDGAKRVALYGVGEATELAYLTVRELGLDPVAVYADVERATFFDVPVRPVAEVAHGDFDRLVVVALGAAPDPGLAAIARAVPRYKLIVLGQAALDAPEHES